MWDLQKDIPIYKGLPRNLGPMGPQLAGPFQYSFPLMPNTSTIFHRNPDLVLDRIISAFSYSRKIEEINGGTDCSTRSPSPFAFPSCKERGQGRSSPYSSMILPAKNLHLVWGLFSHNDTGGSLKPSNFERPAGACSPSGPSGHFTKFAVEMSRLQMIYPLKIVNFYGYVKLPEGIKYQRCGKCAPPMTSCIALSRPRHVQKLSREKVTVPFQLGVGYIKVRIDRNTFDQYKWPRTINNQTSERQS